MSWIDDNDLETEYYEYMGLVSDFYKEAKSMDLKELAEFILENIDYIDREYQKMNKDIANKAIEGNNLTLKQRNCLNNAYAFVMANEIDSWKEF